MASSTPFTKEGESASPKRFAISTASSMITDAGVSLSVAGYGKLAGDPGAVSAPYEDHARKDSIAVPG